MIKKTTISAVIALISINANTVKAGEYSVYGKAEVQVSHTDKGLLRYIDKGTQIDAPFSRIGIKGSHAISESTALVFKYEVQVKGFDADFNVDPMASRNTYVGLKGDLGTILVGRNDTRFKYSEGKVDQFNETQSDMAQVIAGQYRVGDTVTYTTPKFGQWQAAFTYAPQDDAINNEHGVAALLSYGDRAMKSTPYYFALSYSDSLLNLKATRFTAAYKLNKFQFGAIAQQSENLTGSKEGNALLLSARYFLSKTWQPKIQFARDTSGLRHDGDATQYSGGIDYIVDKQTSFYFLATQLDLEQDNDTSTALGVKYKF